MVGRVLRSGLLLAATCAAAGCIDWASLDDGYQASDAGPDGDGGDGGDGDTGMDSGGVASEGCSDGTREGIDGSADLAACAGAWSVRGIVDAKPPACDRQAGNDGTLSSGDECNASDLCAIGWRVCEDAADVSDHGGADGCAELASRPANTAGIYLTRQRGNPDTDTCTGDGSGNSTSDDVFGCGGPGIVVNDCDPLNRKLALPGDCPDPFDCGLNVDTEGAAVLKAAVENGGVLCCREMIPASGRAAQFATEAEAIAAAATE